VDKHEEGQGNPREEVGLDSQGLRSLLGFGYYHFIHDFFKVARTLPDLSEKMAILRMG
jgi:hypothetical protein